MQTPRTTKKEVLTQFRTREILAATRQLLEQRGSEAVTMEDIAARAGLAKGTLYLYFRSKEDLLQALLSQVGEQMESELTAILAAASAPPAKLDQALAMLMQYLERERVLFPLYLRTIFAGGRRGEGRDNQVLAVERRVLALFARLFAEGMARGDFIAADPALLTFLLRGLVRAVGLYQMAGGGRDAVRQALPVVSAIVFSGFLRADRSGAGEVKP